MELAKLNVEKISIEDQKRNREKLTSIFNTCNMFKLYMDVSKEPGEILLLIRYNEGTSIEKEMITENSDIVWQIPCIPVFGVKIEEKYAAKLIEKVKGHDKFNNIVEVEYFDEYSFIDIAREEN